MLPEQSEILKIVVFKTSRSGGSGGQHVNKVSTKVELIFDIEKASFFTDEEKLRLKERLISRLDNEGLLHVVSQEERSQLLNKQRATLKLLAILKSGLQVPRKRKPTRIPRAVKEKRLTNKSILARKKEARKRPGLE